MSRARFALLLALASLTAAPAAALAAEAHGKPAGEGKKAEGNYIDLATVALPIVWRGQVVNYVFVDVRVNLTPRADPNKVREKEPFIRDALVRLGSARPFTRPGDFTHIDRAALFAALRPQAERIAGPGLVAGFTVMKEAPKRRTNLPQPSAAPTAEPASLPGDQ